LPDFLSLDEVAQILDPNKTIGITARSVRSEIDNGKLHAVTIARKRCVARAALDEYIRRLSEVPAPQAPGAADAARRSSSSGGPTRAEIEASNRRLEEVSRKLKTMKRRPQS